MIACESRTTDETPLAVKASSNGFFSEVSAGPGEFISERKAYEKLQAYFNYREELEAKNGLKWNPDEEAYAFGFGIDKLEQLVNAINEYNNSTDDPIGGVRIYMARKTDGSATGERNDVFFMPYLQSTGEDFYGSTNLNKSGFDAEILSESDSTIILNNSKPCPPFCPEEGEG
ncbi:hypothetical protein BXY85_3853 [Roseivirga pacifica]|uniref:Uncharacterized protein n=1 Tax=Roseivirga pacifica TaxID=1267423 RepID=A0A1I0Q5C1_9BACT|nr:hypothetical protein [Roseivirga pacifica]RKQ43234.1 hypothetical protein BXY85_3853 [Roseivirga pacifica]SEW22077.1 hypothetical protein SAMN05216290_2022 [Roseivirga pacifica]